MKSTIRSSDFKIELNHFKKGEPRYRVSLQDALFFMMTHVELRYLADSINDMLDSTFSHQEEECS